MSPKYFNKIIDIKMVNEGIIIVEVKIAMKKYNYREIYSNR